MLGKSPKSSACNRKRIYTVNLLMIKEILLMQSGMISMIRKNRLRKGRGCRSRGINECKRVALQFLRGCCHIKGSITYSNSIKLRFVILCNDKNSKY